MELASYPYLGMSLALTLLFAVGLLARPAERQLALWSAALQMPLGFLSVFFVPAYWQPARLFVLGAGPEDLLFSFASGGLVWLFAAPPGGRLERAVEPRTIARRYAAFAVPGVAAGALLVGWGLGPMSATVVVGLAAAAVLVRRQRHLLRLALAGAVGFGLLYPAVLALAGRLWPHFPGQWSESGSWGLRLAGLPLEEVVWALGGGAVWPLFVAFLVDARLAGAAPRGPAAAPAGYSWRRASTAGRRTARQAG